MATSSSPKSVTAARTMQLVKRAVGGGNINLPAANLVVDTFETANMTPTLNNASFRWENNDATSIVTMNPNAQAVWNNGVIANDAAGKDWTAKEGSHSLRFRYSAGQYQEAEQRWNLTGVAQPDLWIRYWLRVPVNYPPHTFGNNKFLGLWMDGYENTSLGSKIVWGLWPGANGTTYLQTQMQDRLRYFGSESMNFINYQTDRGRWMQMVYHAKASSFIGANDAVVETWRRWEDETAFTKLSDFQNVELRMPDNPALPQGWQGSFIMGAANQNWPEETEFFIDNFELSTGALI
jgi:hypothetical protein